MNIAHAPAINRLGPDQSIEGRVALSVQDAKRGFASVHTLSTGPSVGTIAGRRLKDHPRNEVVFTFARKGVLYMYERPRAVFLYQRANMCRLLAISTYERS